MSQPVKPVAQSRSANTRDRLIQAVRELLAAKDFDAISVQDIANQAGVAVGTVYRRFENKDAFIPAVVQAYRNSLSKVASDPDSYAASNPEAVLVITDEMDLRDALQAFAQVVCRQLAIEPGLMRLVYLTARMRPELIEDEWADLEQAQIRQIEILLGHFSKDIRRSDHRKAAIVVATLITGGLIDKVLFPNEAAAYLAEIESDDLATQLADAAYAYLVNGD